MFLLKQTFLCPRVARRLVTQLVPDVRSNHNVVTYRSLKVIENVKSTASRVVALAFERFCNWGSVEQISLVAQWESRTFWKLLISIGTHDGTNPYD